MTNMTKEKKSRPFKYMWRDLVMKIPHNSEAGRYKAFAYTLVEYLHGDAVTCFPGLERLAADAGMSARTASTAGDALDASEWIIRAVGGKGGKGDSTEYCLRIPCNMLHALDADTMQLLACELRNHLKPIYNQSTREKEIGKRKEREQIPSPSLDPSIPSETETALDSETNSTSPMDNARASLPVATDEQRFAWGDAWPDDAAAIEPLSSNAPIEACHRRITYDALEVLGYSDSDPAPADSGAKYRDRWLIQYLPADMVAVMAKQKQMGRLKNIDIANALASLNIMPKSKEGAKHAEEA